jgi:hypothetical protein
VVHKVISDTKFAFLEGRQLVDSNLVANELVDEDKKKKKEVVLFKVDFGKNI